MIAWKYDENSPSVYKRVHRHSPDMISIAYEPPTAETFELIKQLRSAAGRDKGRGIVASGPESSADSSPSSAKDD